jgi:DHA2 family multidrug resistance protein
MSSLNIPFQQMTKGLNGSLGQSFGHANSQALAGGAIYQQLQQQAAMQGYQDVYMLLFWMALGMVFLSFLLSKNKPGAGGGGAAMH